MSIIDSLKAYFGTFSGVTGSVILTDFLGSLPEQFAIVPLSGERVTAVYLNDTKVKEFPFAFQAMKYSADEFERMTNVGFYDEFADWMDDQTDADILPTLSAGRTAQSIQALGQGYLLTDGEAKTGIYEIQCKLVYEQVASS